MTHARRPLLPVYIILALALAYLAWLVTSSQPGVFFSSDGAIKYMVVRQFTAGHGFKYLYLPQPQWVHQIWDTGYFPLRPPFIYPSPQGYLFVFPPAFQVISAFFYQNLGMAGLYIVPVCSILLLWLSLILLLRRSGIPSPYIAMALFIIVFCSPLTIYGATYWEHIPAILLLFSGIAFILHTPSRPGVAAAMGLLSGLAAWFRPEALAMNSLYVLATIILFKYENRAPLFAFLVGVALSIGSFLLFNKIELGSFLGIHSYQVLHQGDPGRTASAIENLYSNNKLSVKYFCFIVFLLPIGYVLLTPWAHALFTNRRRTSTASGTSTAARTSATSHTSPSARTLNIRILLLIAIIIAFCALTPFLVPNDGGRQWGARYILPIIPILTVVLTLIAYQWQALEKGRWAPALLALLLFCSGYSLYLNTYKGGIMTLRRENFYRIKPDLDFITQQKSNVVIVSFPYIAMELGYLFNDKYFFLAPDDSSLRRLLPLLKTNGIHEYTYIYDKRVPDNQPLLLKSLALPIRAENGDFYFEHYPIP